MLKQTLEHILVILFCSFSVDLTRQDSFWAVSVGYTATMVSTIVIHQTGVQKYLSVPKFRHCIWYVFLTMWLYLIYII